MDYKKVAKDVIDAIGADNLQAAAHCATRLRLVVKDEGKINQKALDSNSDVKGHSRPMVSIKLLLDQVRWITFMMN